VDLALQEPSAEPWEGGRGLIDQAQGRTLEHRLRRGHPWRHRPGMRAHPEFEAGDLGAVLGPVNGPDKDLLRNAAPGRRLGNIVGAPPSVGGRTFRIARVYSMRVSFGKLLISRSSRHFWISRAVSQAHGAIYGSTSSSRTKARDAAAAVTTSHRR
jgi:hypothetical protein